ncbi:MAG: thiolase family protein [Deinococcales bacterium]|jgi:acetyl-CoA acetyltransferase family protein
MFVPSPRTVAVVDGSRIPFLRAGGGYASLIAYDLARMAVRGLLDRAQLDAARLDAVILGSVVQNPATSNVARDAALAAGVPERTPAYTVTMACISANRAIADAGMMIAAGQADTVLAGGVEMLGDVPIGFTREVRRRFFETRKYKSALDWRRFFAGLKPSELMPQPPAIAEYSTGETMGRSADRLAAAFGIARGDQDAYALRSHQGAAHARSEGLLGAEITPVAVPPGFDALEADDGIREDTSLERLAKLGPAFVKPFGTVTAGNSSPLTDGAAATLLMDEERARADGRRVRARVRDFVFVAQDPGDELLLGPAYAVPRLLERNGLSWSDLDVVEIHEAFAGQVLAVLAALESDAFARERLGREERVARVDLDRVNPWGGSVSLGHPFGATGSRLVNTAVHRLEHEDGKLALVTACAAGGQGHAMLLERGDA